MLSLKLSADKELNLLCIGAHCDDIEIGCGGTILKLFKEYNVNSVMWIVFSSDSVRKEEALTSAELFLKKSHNNMIEIKSYRDGFLPASAAKIKDEFEDIKNTYNPDLIFTHYREDLHQDHRLLNELTWNTFRHHLILEYEIPKFDGDIGNPNLYFPLDEDIVKKKNEIILNSFKSQKEKHWFNEETFKAILRLRGLESVSRFSEAYYARKLVV